MPGFIDIEGKLQNLATILNDYIEVQGSQDSTVRDEFLLRALDEGVNKFCDYRSEEAEWMLYHLRQQARSVGNVVVNNTEPQPSQ